MITLLTILAAASWFFFILRREVIRDLKAWKEGRYADINHRSGWIRRAYCLVPCIGLLTVAIQPHGWQLLIAGLISTVLCAFAWWLLFDGWFNNIRGFNWWYTGSDDPNDAHTDDLIQGLRKWQHIAVKAGACVIFLTAYILLLWK